MKTTQISTLTAITALRASIMKAQSDLVSAQQEATTGRRADVGLALGSETAPVIGLRVRLDDLQGLSKLNELSAARLDIAQSALDQLAGLATSFASSIIAARGAVNGQEIAQKAAETALSQFQSLANTAHDGQYLFAGIKTDVPPLADYFSTPASAAKSAVDAAFLAEFGISQNDPAVNGISGAAMDAFVNGAFASLFSPAAWQGTWSQASTETVSLRMESDLRLDVPATANDRAFRELGQALTMIADLGTTQLGAEAFQSLVDKAAALATTSVLSFSLLQSSVGMVEEAMAGAQTRMKTEIGLITGDIQSREGVDPYEAATRVNTIMIQLQSSYELTGRIGQLSLLNFI